MTAEQTRSMLVVGAAAAACAALLCGASSAADPQTVLTKVREAYRSGPVAERVTVRVENEEGRGRTDRVLLRITSSEEGGPIIDLALGDLRVRAKGGSILAVNTRNTADYFAVEFDGPLTIGALERALPPLPVPQVYILLSGGDAGFTDITPYARSVTWRGVREPDGGDDGPIVLTGRMSGGTVTLRADPLSYRLLEFEAAYSRAGSRLEIAAAPIDPDEPIWTDFQPDERTRVGSLSRLTPTRPPREVGVGSTLPEMVFLSASSERWSLPGVFGSGEADDEPAPMAVLIFLRDVDAERVIEQRRLVTAAEEAIERFGEDGEGEAAVRFEGSRVVLLADLARADVGERIDAAAGRYGDAFVWTPDSIAVANLLPGDATASIVVVDRGLVVRAVVALDGQAEDGVLSLLTSALLGEGDNTGPD